MAHGAFFSCSDDQHANFLTQTVSDLQLTCLNLLTTCSVFPDPRSFSFFASALVLAVLTISPSVSADSHTVHDPLRQAGSRIDKVSVHRANRLIVR